LLFGKEIGKPLLEKAGMRKPFSDNIRTIAHSMKEIIEALESEVGKA